MKVVFDNARYCISARKIEVYTPHFIMKGRSADVVKNISGNPGQIYASFFVTTFDSEIRQLVKIGVYNSSDYQDSEWIEVYYSLGRDNVRFEYIDAPKILSQIAELGNRLAHFRKNVGLKKYDVAIDADYPLEVLEVEINDWRNSGYSCVAFAVENRRILFRYENYDYSQCKSMVEEFANSLRNSNLAELILKEVKSFNFVER